MPAIATNRRPPQTASPLPVIPLPLLLLLLLYYHLLAPLAVGGVAPTIDYSHNMRILKLPLSTPVGSLIYRLKGSDGDPNTQLVFGVSGISGRALLDVLPVARSWNEADVYLRAPLAEQTTYNLTIFVSDGNMTTQVESTVYPTDDSSNQLSSNGGTGGGGAGAGSLSPFLNPRHVFHVPESAKPDEPIGFVTALESEKSDLPVRFELRGKGADKFSIKYVFGPKGQSRADIVLSQQLDYEKQNLFNLKVLALNAWTNTRLDTRNVAVMDIVITVGDLQDTPPVFRNLPPLLKLPNTLQPGDVVAKIEAEDGDYADQRGVNFALDAASPLSNYFDIDKFSGQVKLIKPLAELAMHSAWDSSTWSQLTVFASEAPDPSSYDRLWPPMYSRADIQLVLVDTLNLAPRFLGGWQTGGGNDHHHSQQVLHGYLLESASQVSWYTNGSSSSETGQSSLLDNLIKSVGGRPSVLDLGIGSNGTFELLLEGTDAHNFQVEPSFPVAKQSTFTLSLAPDANRSLFDHEQVTAGGTRRTFSLDIVAKDFGTPQRMSSRVRCLIELLDVDDNSPSFEQDLYSFSVYENAQLGQQVGQVRARDPDSGDLSRVRYTALTGHDSQVFALNPDTGQVTLDGHLDREKKSLYLYLVEARDASGTGKANYSQVLISVLDVNDNAPVFLQQHYDAVLLADGTFHQPLIVRALDADEPGSANSQVAYEIIAGNQNELFAIDSLSGAIYPSGNAPADSLKNNHLPQIPSILNEPIVPFTSPAASSQQHSPELAGKILPTNREVEETTYPSLGSRQAASQQNQSLQLSSDQQQQQQQQQQQRYSGVQVEPDSSTSYRLTSVAPHSFDRNRSSNRRMHSAPPAVDPDQLPALDLLLNLESEQSERPAVLATRSVNNLYNQQAFQSHLTSSGSSPASNALKVPPVTTLIVRAHDFGIPIRSSTVKVNIYNQALLSRSVSVILNGTAEQLEQRREAIERAFSSITGSKASIESIDALSESSSISVARIRLAVPQHSLVDLTDLSALMSAIDYHSHEQQQQQQQWRQPLHYLTPSILPGMSSNVSSGQAGNLYNPDIHSFAMSDTNNLLERRLLLYIIIVAVCILALLVIWMVYSCSRESQVKIEKAATHPIDNFQSGRYQATQTDNSALSSNKTYVKSAINSPIGNNLSKSHLQLHQQHHLQRPSASTVGLSSTMNELLPGTTVVRPDHLSMYNGQVWFEPSSSRQVSAARQRARLQERRASSAPSATSLDSALRSALHHSNDWRSTRNASGQFFPNTIGYMENLAALEERAGGGTSGGGGGGSGQETATGTGTRRTNHQRLARRQRSRKVAPMSLASESAGRVNRAFVLQEEQQEELMETTAGSRRSNAGTGERKQPTGRQTSGELSSAGASSLGDESADEQVLGSDQELLGFDSTGTPIIATHARPPPSKSLVIDMLEPADLVTASAQVRYLPAGARRGGTGGRRASNSAMTQTEVETVAQTVAAPQVQVKVDMPKPVQQTSGDRPASSPNEQPEPVQVAPPVDGRHRASEGMPGKATLQRQATTEVAPPNEVTCSEHKLSSGESGGSGSGSGSTKKAADGAETTVSSHSGRSSVHLRKANSQGDLMGELNARLNGRKRQEQRASVDGPIVGEGTTTAGSPGQTAVMMVATESDLSTGTTLTNTTPTAEQQLRDMKNGELLEKQSIFALTYSGLSSDWQRRTGD